MHRILIIDRASFGASLAPMLERENLCVALEADARAGVRRALETKPELLLLNLPLSGMSPVEFGARVRDCPTRLPLVLLGEDGEAERVRLFEAGADDYLVKPFSLRELLARLRAILRRTAAVPAGVIRFGRIEADLDRRMVTRDGQEVGFTPVEYNLFVFFLRRAGRLIPREEVMNSIWGYAGCFKTRETDVRVMKLRQKLECDPASPHHLQSVHGIGYRFLI